MQISRRRMVLGFLVLLALAAGTAAEAQQYCQDIACFIPPQARCSQECLYCDGVTSGTEYSYPPYCDHPSTILVGQLGCPCLQASMPSLDPAAPSFDLDKLLGLPAGTLTPGHGEAAGKPSPPAGQR